MDCPKTLVTLVLTAAILSTARTCFAQTSTGQPATPIAATAPTAVPTLVPYSGIATDANDKALSGEAGVTFLIYKDEQGGEALWTETQTVALDSAGHYKIQLGAASPSGLPTDLFATGEARWLEVQVAGQTPQPRVLLASVPYALKAADASTLGGLPASAYALAGGNVKASATTPDAASTISSPNGAGTITGVKAGLGLTGGGTTGTVTLAVDTTKIPTLADNPTFTGTTTFNSTTSGNSAVVANASTGVGVHGSSVSGWGILGQSQSNDAILGLSGSGYGVVGQSGSGTGIAAEATTGNGLYAYATTGSAAFMVSSPPEKASLYVFNDGHADGSSNVPQGIYASASGIGVNAYAPGGIGVFGVAHGQSNLASALLKDHYGAGTWGDTSGDLISQFDLGGVVGTADGNNAGAFYNNSNAYATLYLYNWGPGGTGLFRTLQADTSDGTCGFGGKGDLTCTGQVKTLATTGGARTLETYAMQSPENWMEDFGSGALSNGVATVAIDPAFAETVNTSTDYYIFLTPNGDSKGLYVTARTASGFEVRESGGGDSSLTFDYRIVAKRRGYESERLTDVTEQFQAQMERASLPRRAAASGRTTQPNIQPSSAPR